MKTIKILWIDDMESWAQSAQSNLKLVGSLKGITLEVIPAINGENLDIEQKAAWFDFDCIIMDYHMDPQNGDAYIREIRQQEHLENIPILFYSQDNSTNLDELIRDVQGVTTIYRPNLEDKVKELFFK
jgi:CheY-like chemotaxis protein